MSFKHMKIQLVFNDQLTINKLVKDLPMLSGYDTRIVNFQIVVKRTELSELTGNNLNIDCLGEIPVKDKYLHEPIEMNYSTAIVLPQSPIIKINKRLISKDKKHLSYILDITNTNDYVIKLENVSGHVDFKKYSYQFAPPKKQVAIQPQGKSQVKLIASRSSKITPTGHPIISADLTFLGPNLKIVTPLK